MNECPHCGQHSYDPRAEACERCGYMREVDTSRVEPDEAEPIVWHFDRGRVSITCPHCSMSVNAPVRRLQAWLHQMRVHIAEKHPQ